MERNSSMLYKQVFTKVLQPHLFFSKPIFLGNQYMTKGTQGREVKGTVFKCCIVNIEILQSGTGNRMHREREHICQHRN